MSQSAPRRSPGSFKAAVICISAGIFEPYLVMLQTDEPMLSFMFSKLEKIFNRLIRLIFKQEKLTIPITERIKKKRLMNKNNHLEHDALVDIGAATKVSLKSVQLSEEKKNKFTGQCRTMVLDIFVKLAENTPLYYAVVFCASSLSPRNMIRVPQECSQIFVVLADRLVAAKKTPASVADNAKYQFDEFLKVAETQHEDEFLKFCFKVDQLYTFFGKFLGHDSYNDVWTICKTVFIFSHGQSFTEREFSVNKEVVDYNLEEKSLTSQRLVYDAIHNGNGNSNHTHIEKKLLAFSSAVKNGIGKEGGREATQ